MDPHFLDPQVATGATVMVVTSDQTQDWALGRDLCEGGREGD